MASVDNIFAAVTYFALAIFFIVMIVFWNNIAGFGSEFWDISPTSAQVREETQNLVNNFDFILLMAYLGLHLGILVLVFLLRTHPVVYVVALILTAILATIAAPISNAYVEISDDTALSSAAQELSINNYILRNLPKFEVVWGFATIIILLGLARSEGFV